MSLDSARCSEAEQKTVVMAEDNSFPRTCSSLPWLGSANIDYGKERNVTFAMWYLIFAFLDTVITSSHLELLGTHLQHRTDCIMHIIFCAMNFKSLLTLPRMWHIHCTPFQTIVPCSAIRWRFRSHWVKQLLPGAVSNTLHMNLVA